MTDQRAIKANSALNFILPTTAPVISAGVIIANIIWNAAYTRCGILSAYGPASQPTPFNPSQSKLPITPPWSLPNESEYPKSVHIDTDNPMIATQAIIVFTTFFLLTSPP